MDCSQLEATVLLHGKAATEYADVAQGMQWALRGTGIPFLYEVSYGRTLPRGDDGFPSLNGIADSEVVVHGRVTVGDGRMDWRQVERPDGYVLAFQVTRLDRREAVCRATTLRLVREYRSPALSDDKSGNDTWMVRWDLRDTDSPYQLALSDLERTRCSSIAPDQITLHEQLRVARELGDCLVAVTSERTGPYVGLLMGLILVGKLKSA